MADTPTKTQEQDLSAAEMTAAEDATVEAGNPETELAEREFTQEQIDRRAREVGIMPEVLEENEYSIDE